MAPKTQYVGLVFYIFISIVLVSLAVSGAQALFASTGSLFQVVVYLLLFGAHIGLYWLNLRYHPSRRWSIFYYIVQAGLILSLASFPYTRDGIRIGILGSASICIIGETLGLWGNTRRSLWIGLAYAALAAVVLFLRVDREVLGDALSGLLFNTVFIVLFMIVLNQQFAERDKAQELAERLESANARLAANAAQIESLTLQNERQRMARELHDTLAQGVAGLVLQLEAVRAHLSAQRVERASAIVDQALGRARSTLAASRAAIDDLRTDSSSLPEAVRERVERFTQATGIPCELEVSVQGSRLPAAVADHALNILSEALTNITRHAQATHVQVRFIQQEGLELEVCDDGQGFDAEQQIATRHYGLLGMRERARLTGGTLSIQPNLPHGTRLQFVVHPASGGGAP